MKFGFSFFSAAALVACTAVSGFAEVRLPALISDHMVLQQGTPVRIWGWADAGEPVSVSFRGKTSSVIADPDGRWQVVLSPLIPSAPADLEVKGTSQQIVIHDVLVGEVWVASGQSNMALNMDTAANSAEEESHANYPAMRLFHAAIAVRDQPADDVKGRWELCSPASVKTFSAVAYYFGRDLLQQRKAPVGLIEASVGGTPAEAWTSGELLKSDPSLDYVYKEWQQHIDEYPANKAKYDDALAAWQATHQPGSAADAKPAPAKPVGPGHPWTPSGLYNGMIVPIAPYGIRGFIWYQGEWNARDEAHSLAYRRVFPMMIENWRRLWGREDLPFLFVQLPNFNPAGSWVTLRDSQSRALPLRNTAMVVTLDVGDPHNIHPKNKLPVGQRLALAARSTVYGEAVEYTGPTLRQAIRDGAGFRLWFDHAEGLRSRTDQPLQGFELAGADGKFGPALARIDGESLWVSSSAVPVPTGVRYAWSNDPIATLTNKSGLPAAPFNTAE